MLPPDPVPIYYPSLEPFIQDETDFHSITAPATIDPTTGIPIPNVTVLQSQAGNDMLEQPTGEPTGLEQNAVMPLENGVHYRVQLSPLSITAVGTDQIAVTFSAAHGLSTNDQIVVQGLADRHACGAYSIAVTSATAFTFQTNTAISAGALLTGSTLMVTANIGVPLGFDQIPPAGG